MAIGVESEAVAEARFSWEVFFRDFLNVVDETVMGVVPLLEDLGEGKSPFLLRHASIEGINTSKLDVSWWPPPDKNERERLERFFLPRTHMRNDIFH